MKRRSVECRIDTPEAMEKLGENLARQFRPGLVIFLHGTLGSGKTTLVRGMLRGLGHDGAVKSPTYTLVEPYRLAGMPVFHFDLYRLRDPEELEFIGLRDYLEDGGVCLVEWAERGTALLPKPDLEIEIEQSEAGRMVRFQACTEIGAQLLREVI